MWDVFRHNLGFSIRTLLRNPGFTAIVLLTLGLGVGANTAVFGLIDSVLLEPLRFGEPERLVAIWESSEREGIAKSPTSAGTYLDWKEQNQTLEGITAWAWNTFILQEKPEAVVLNGVMVDPGFFSVLRAGLLFGRTFQPSEVTPGRRGDVIVISHGLWQRRWGADPDILNRTVTLDGSPVRIVGVMRPNLAAPDLRADLWIPVGFASTIRWERYNRRLQVVGRLKPGVTLEQAQQDFSRIASIHRSGEYQDIYDGWDASLVRLDEEIVGEARAGLWIALAAVGLILLIACVNVSNLLLARATVRRQEIALRTALGAGRLRLAGQLLTEAMVLGLGGGAVGLGLAWVNQRLLLSYQPGSLPRAEEVTLGTHAFLFALGISLLTAFLFGLAPLVKSFSLDLREALHTGGGGAGGSTRRSWLRDLPVAGQLALTLILLCSAGLMIRSLVELWSVDPGFETGETVVARIFLDNRSYDSPEKIAGYYRELAERLGGLPGVASVGASSALPMDPLGINYDLPYRLEGQGEIPTNELPQADFRVVSPGYFESLRVPLLRGRPFQAIDRAGGLQVILVNQTMADLVWPGRDPVGERLQTPSTDWNWFEVAGVVADTRYYGLDSEPRPEMYVALDQVPRLNMAVLVRGETGGGLAERVRREVLAQDAAQPVHSITGLDELVAESVAARRFQALVLAAFAAVALLLSLAGIYGVLSYWVNQRRHEIGIRMALGASRPGILRLVVGYGLLLAAVGGTVGLVAAVFSTRVLEAALFRISASDPFTYAGVLVLLLTVALAASLLPAWRASRLDPALTLKGE